MGVGGLSAAVDQTVRSAFDRLAPAAPSTTRRSSAKRLANRAVLAPDDVVDLENLGGTRMFERNIGEQRHDATSERLELLSRIPDFAYSQLAVRVKGDVIVK